MSFAEKLDSILDKYKELENKLGDPSSMENNEFAKVSKEYSDLGSVVSLINSYKETNA